MGPVDEIKSRLDIVEFIKGYLKLEKAGANWKALCPFHTEKTPSFFVSPSRQMWYCFGCHKGGDAFKFLMELEHLEFPETLRILAEKTGVELKREDPKIRSERIRQLEILEAASKFFQERLAAAPEARAYLDGRGLKDETIAEFGIGFAPPGWENLLEHLINAGFKAPEIEKAGLAIKKESGGFYDRFRSRIMFPIFDAQGRIVGFTGRIFGRESEIMNQGQEIVEAKYVNTPESLVFSKGRVLYGFHKTKHEIRRQNAAVLTEGQMDFLMAWQSGIRNVVATSGTALTSWHLGTLKRLCETLYLAFDMDEAGSQATERGIMMASQQGFNLKIIELPRGKDIADFALEAGGALKDVIGQAIPVMEYYFAKSLKDLPDQNDDSSAGLEKKKEIAAYILPRIKMLKSPVDQAFWLEKLSQKLGFSPEVLKRALDETASLESPVPEAPATVEIVPQKDRLTLVAERALALGLHLQDGAEMLASYAQYFPEPLKNIAGFDKEFLDYLGLQAEYITSIMGDGSPREELAKTLEALKDEHIRRQREKISRDIKAAELAKDFDRLEALSAEFAKLSKNG